MTEVNKFKEIFDIALSLNSSLNLDVILKKVSETEKINKLFC